jgi:hypothetical protein
VKRLLAWMTTGVLLLAALWLGRGAAPPGAAPPTADSPEACLERMFQAAERGDVSAYLDCFTGTQRARLERELRGQNETAFGESLRAAVQQLKGRAIHRPPAAQTSQAAAAADRAEMRVERIYAGRNEQQIYLLIRDGTAWRVRDIRDASAYQPPVPYGTPVY